MVNRNNWFSFLFDNKHIDKMNKINKYFKKFHLHIMKKNWIHMTSVFMGERLMGKQKEDLNELNSIVKNNVQNMKNFNLIMSFDRFDYLPFDGPKKHFVAIYKVNPQINTNNLSLKKAIYEKGFCGDCNELLPHITIGKVKGDNLPSLDIINNANSLKYPDVEIKGLYLCGNIHNLVKSNYLIR